MCGRINTVNSEKFYLILTLKALSAFEKRENAVTLVMCFFLIIFYFIFCCVYLSYIKVLLLDTQ